VTHPCEHCSIIEHLTPEMRLPVPADYHSSRADLSLLNSKKVSHKVIHTFLFVALMDAVPSLRAAELLRSPGGALLYGAVCFASVDGN
jgi:hypothetical protein